MRKLMLSLRDCADRLQLSERHFRRLATEGVFVAEGREYDFWDTLQRYLRHLKTDHAGREARTEESRARAMRQRIQAHKLLGQLLSLDEQAEHDAELFATFWNAAQAVSSQAWGDLEILAPDLPEWKRREITAAFHRHIQAWTRLARDSVVERMRARPTALLDDVRIAHLLRQIEETDDRGESKSHAGADA